MSTTEPGKKVALYLRVSTDQQSTRNQERELRAVAARHGWHIVAVFKDDGISGTKDRSKRPGLDKLLKGVVRKEFDLVAVWSTDRLGRSMPKLVRVLELLKAKGVNLFDHRHGIDTSTDMGQMFFYLAGIFAQIERNLIVERVRAGLKRAKAEGVVLGRPKTVTPETEAQILAHLEAGEHGVHKIAKLVGVGSSTVQRINDVRRGRTKRRHKERPTA
jgi:DNA invertase Pin-like site-specific DNA recombinase